MAAVSKIDSNVTGLRVAKESTIGVLPGTPIWYPLEPNSYGDFGGNVTTVARETINDARSRQKGVTTDVEASGNLESDLTQDSLQHLWEGLFYAAYAKKAERFNNHVAESVITDASESADDFTFTTGDEFRAGDLVFASGFTNSANNGLHLANAVSGATVLSVTSNVIDEVPPALARLVTVGFEFDSADATIVVPASAFPSLVTSTKDLTELGITPGEFVYIGGDAADESFAVTANNGWARVRSITSTVMTFDKTSAAMATDAGTGQTIRIFFGRTVQNKVGADIVRTTYQLERKLGAADDSNPTHVQSEYLKGSCLNEMTINIPTAEKVTTETTFMSKDVEHRAGAASGSEALKSGTRPTLVSMEAFNSSSDVARIRLAAVSTTDEFPTALFSFVMEGSVSINNNNARNQALGTVGAFDYSAGTFEVSAEVTAYFQNVAALTSIRNNDDVSLDITMVKDNAGLAIDLPLLTLGGGLAQVELNEPVKLPLTSDASQATSIDAAYTHTAKVCVFDYLPDAAE